MEVLDCPKCLKNPEVIDGEPIYCCGILAGDTRLWNNYAYAMRIAMTITFSKYTKTPIDKEELNESWDGFDKTSQGKQNA